jgi:Stage II sporulation protein E (SpoIIE)
VTDSRTATFTTEFGQEFEAEREAWLRRRFLWYTGIYGGVMLLVTAFGASALFVVDVREVESGPRTEAHNALILAFVVSAIATGIYATGFWRAYRGLRTREQLIAAVTLLIVTTGIVQFIGGYLNWAFAPQVMVKSGLSLNVSWMFSLLSKHILACLFLPLTPREAIRPIVPLLAIYMCAELFSGHDALSKALVIGSWPLVGLPGAGICWWRHSRFRERFNQRMIRGRYIEMRRELVDARRIHEALFPAPVRSGPIRFEYAYEPMRQIGGDYLHLCFAPPGPGGDCPMSLVVIDVTGHGIPAALTVNRLHGELQRIFAENPTVPPGEVLRLLNSYVHLTLAGHSVYVTAFCVKADPSLDTLDYASGGHPPAFLRGVDGTIEQLASTAFVLGACPSEDFRPDPRTLRFGPGDTLIAYTDGAIEARDRVGRYFGVGGLQRILAAASGTGTPRPAGTWPSLITKAVDQHRFGPIADDTLVVEVTRPLDTSVPKSAPFRSAAAARA